MALAVPSQLAQQGVGLSLHCYGCIPELSALVTAGLPLRELCPFSRWCDSFSLSPLRTYSKETERFGSEFFVEKVLLIRSGANVRSDQCLRGFQRAITIKINQVQSCTGPAHYGYIFGFSNMPERGQMHWCSWAILMLISDASIDIAGGDWILDSRTWRR